MLNDDEDAMWSFLALWNWKEIYDLLDGRYPDFERLHVAVSPSTDSD